MSLGDVKKLPAKDVEKYFNRYQITLGNQVASGLDRYSSRSRCYG